LGQVISSKEKENKTLFTQLQKVQNLVEELQSKSKSEEKNANVELEKNLASVEVKYYSLLNERELERKTFIEKEQEIEELKVDLITKEARNKYLIDAHECEYKSPIEKLQKIIAIVEEKTIENKNLIAKINECQSIIYGKNNIIESINENKSKLHLNLDNVTFPKKKEIEELKVEQLNIKNKTIIVDESTSQQVKTRILKQNENKNVNQEIEVMFVR